MPSSQIRRQLVLRNISDSELDRKIFAYVKSRLFTRISDVRSNTVKSIVLQANAKFNFDSVDYDSIGVENSEVCPKDKFLRLASLVENQSQSERSVLTAFLNLLLNLDGLGNTSASIEQLIKLEFGQLVDIQKKRVWSKSDLQREPFLDSFDAISSHPTSKLTEIIIIIKSYPKLTLFILSLLLFICGLIMFRNELITLLHASLFLSVSTADNSTELSRNITNSKSTSPVAAINSSSESHIVLPSDIKTNITVVSTSTEIIRPTLLTLSQNDSPKNRPKYTVTARSYKGYIQRMIRLPPNHEIIVRIELRSSLDWPTERNIILPNSSEINKLLIDGPISVDNLIDFLSQTANVKLLQIRNTGDKLCQRNHGQLNLVRAINKQAYLPLLESVIIEYFTSCVEVYETLAMHLESLRELKSIVLHRSLIDDYNHVFINQMLKNNADHLNQLKLAKNTISLSKPLFEEGGLLTLPRVNTLRLDSVTTDGQDNEIPIGIFLSKIFPNLHVLYSKHGYVQWSNIPKILKCRNLTILDLRIQVPVGRTFFDVSFFKKYLPNVSVAHIYLKFAACKITKNEIIGWENVKYPMSEILVRSNCKIRAIMSDTATSLQYYKVQEYKSENGTYIFTYKNK